MAAATFRDAFGADNAADDMDGYVAEAFSPVQQAAEIADPNGAIFLAEYRDASGAELVGYTHLVAGPAPEAVSSHQAESRSSQAACAVFAASLAS